MLIYIYCLGTNKNNDNDIFREQKVYNKFIFIV